jgi:hypothetical protein
MRLASAIATRFTGLRCIIPRPAHLQFHQPLGGEADHFMQQIRVGGFFSTRLRRFIISSVIVVSGTGWCLQPDPAEELAMTTAPPPGHQRLYPRRRAAALPAS